MTPELINAIIGAVFGAGGIGGVAGWIKLRDSRAKNRLETGATTIDRLEKENIRAVKRADDAEAAEERLRERNRELYDELNRYRGILIQHRLLPERTPDDAE